MKPTSKSMRRRSGWKESPRKPLSAEAKKRQREWLANWRARFSGLVAAEMERR